MRKAAALKGSAEHIPALAVLVLAVPDARSAARFYEAAFGWLVIVREPSYVEFSLPNTMRLGLYKKQGFALHTTVAPVTIPEGALAPTELYIHVEDLDAAIAKLLMAGARQLAPVQTKDWGDEAAYFADPFGNVIAIARPHP